MKRISTKDIIAKTMLELLKIKTIEEITVTEIAQEIEISTRTFYRYFSDKYEVCNYIYGHALESQCWYNNGHRCNLREFFENICSIIAGEYNKFFENTMCYHGQNSIHEFIISYGVNDLITQLKYTGHEELVTEETIPQMEFFMHGLDNVLTLSMGNRSKRDLFLHVWDKTKFLPKDISDALNDEPVYAQTCNTKKSR